MPKKVATGVVASATGDKTRRVEIQRRVKHPTYGKYIRRQKKYMVHDPQNACQTGDRVRIIESRPISKRKRWQVIEVIESSGQ